MTVERNPQAAALAFKKCRGKLMKIKELEITADMSDEDADTLIELLAEAKVAADSALTLADQVKGQRWYVEGLIAFAGLGGDISADERAVKQFEQEYQDSFADTASEAEMHEAITEMAA